MKQQITQEQLKVMNDLDFIVKQIYVFGKDTKENYELRQRIIDRLLELGLDINDYSCPRYFPLDENGLNIVRSIVVLQDKLLGEINKIEKNKKRNSTTICRS